MKSLSVLAILSLLAITLPLIIARDPGSLQDFCVSTNSSLDGAFVNGEFCKDPRLVTADDFSYSGLNRPGRLNPVTGSIVTPVSVNELLGLNTLGITIVRIDYGINGQNTPHYHPRATEVINLQKGRLLVGFITSNPENRFITRILNEGDVFVFPQALIHFQQNIGNKPAVAFSSLSSQNPGVVTVANAVFGSNPLIEEAILSKAFQLDPRIVRYLQNRFKKQ